MCGIAGIYNLDDRPVSRRHIEKMGSILSHRGPENNGFFAAGAIGLAHRRLKIIDLSSCANQPMWDNENRALITYNGMLYNFRELRQGLIKNGFKFRSQTDTEVIVNSYLKWG